MYRKDCDSLRRHLRVLTSWTALGGIAALTVGWLAQPAGGAAVRMWPKTVVDRDEIRVADVAEVLNAVPGQASRFGAVVVGSSPTPGQETEVALDDVRQALIKAGANPIEFTVRGAVRCHVTRPLTLRVVDSGDQQPASSRWWWPATARNRPDGHAGDDRTLEAASVVPDEITVAAHPAAGPAVTLEEARRTSSGSTGGARGGSVRAGWTWTSCKAASSNRPSRWLSRCR